MTRIKKLLALSLSVLMILSALPVTSWAAEEVIKWKAGYTNSSGELEEGYADIPYSILLKQGSEGTINQIGADYSYYLTVGQNDHKIYYEVTPTYTGKYKLEAEVAGAGTDYFYWYLGDEEIGSIEASTGAFNAFDELQTVAEVMLEAGVPVTIGFVNKNDGGTGSSSVRDIVLTLVEETQLPDDDEPGADVKQEVITWLGGYDTGNQGNTSGTLYDGYADIPWYVTNISNGNSEPIGAIGQDWGAYTQISNNTCYLNFDITPSYTGEYRLDLKTASENGGELKVYVDGVEKLTYTAEATGGWNNFSDIPDVTEAGTLILEGGRANVISFAKTSGSVTLRDCVLTFVRETGLPDDDDDNIDDGSTPDAPDADYAIKWKAGYTVGNPAAVADGYADIPYFIILASGSEGTINQVGSDYGDYVLLSSNNHRLCFEVTPEYSGVYKLEAEVAGSETDYFFGYADDTELGSVEASTGGFNTFGELQEVGELILYAGEAVTISFVNKSGDGTGNSSIRDCVLTLVEGVSAEAIDLMEAIDLIGEVTLENEAAIIAAEEAYEALSETQKKFVTNYEALVEARKALDKLKNPDDSDDPDTPDVPQIPSDYAIKWMGGYTSASADDEPNGTIADGYDDIPYYVTNKLGGETVSYGNLGGNWGHAFNISTASYLNFDITPEYTGLYQLEIVTASKLGSSVDVYQDGVKAGTLAIAATDNDIGNYHPLTIIAILDLEAGKKTTLSFCKTPGANSLGLKDCVLSIAKPFTYEGASIDDGATVARSTDVITLDFSRTISEKAISEAEISLTDFNGAHVEITCVPNKEDPSKVDVILARTLEFSKSYILTHNKVNDGFGSVLGEETINFSVASEQDDISRANTTIELEEPVLSGKTFTIKGTVYGSKGQTIAGRGVIVSIGMPAAALAKDLAPVTVGADGKFTVVYTLTDAEDDVSGMYTIFATEEYSIETVEKQIRYITDEDRETVIGGIQSAASGADIENIINASNNNGTTNSDIVGVDVSIVESTFGNDKTNFYDRLVDATFTDESGNYDETLFKEAWDLAYTLEHISYADDEAVTLEYFDAENNFLAQRINLNSANYNILSEQKDEFITAVTELPREKTASAEIFGEECNRLLNEMGLLEKGKSDLAPTVSNLNVYVGQTADADLRLAAPAEDIAGYTLTVTCPDAQSAEAITIDVPSGASFTKSVSGSTVTFDVTYERTQKLDTLGKIRFSRAATGTDSFSVQGTVTYSIENKIDDQTTEKAVLTDTILSAAYTVSTVLNNNKSETGSSTTITSGGGGGGGGSFSPVVTPSAPVTGEDIKADGFTDLADVAWAEESIMNLYKKGIISEAADGRFRPNDSVTRAEFVKMLVTALRITDKAAPVALSDVSQSDWFYTYVAAAVNYGLVLGDEKGNFNPTAPITRQDICVIISRAMDKLGYGESEADTALFYDDAQISDYAKKAVYRMRAHEIVNGTGDGGFAPLANADRASTAKMIEKFMKEANI